MIEVQLNKDDFEYDIHSLVKAFFPSENVSVYTPQKREWDSLKRQNRKQNICQNLETDDSKNVHLILIVRYETNQIAMMLQTVHQPDGQPQSVRAELTEAIPYTKWETVQEALIQVDSSDRRDTKNRLKQAIYHLLCAYTRKTLPWGTLTGIRPTKIAMTMLEAGKTGSEVAAYMQNTYETSKEKTELSIAIATRELELLNRLDYKQGYSLYIGIPFCPSTCLYCSFTSYPIAQWEARMDAYLCALEKEITYMAEHFADRLLNSIYIGGGTPTTLAPHQLDRLLTKLEQSFDLSHLLEFTVEAGRPDSIDMSKLEVLRAHSISRISINPQTMKQETLDLIGRKHTVEQTVQSFKMARSMGFDNINMDLIMGLPQETLADVKHTLEVIQTLGPDSVTVHSLALKRAARLQMFREDYAALTIVNTQEHLDAAANACSQMDMVPYYLYRQKNMAGNFENVGYAKAGKFGIYNVLMMEEKQTIVACGAGSISKRVYPDGHIERCENVKDVASFIERIDEMIGRKRKLLVE